MSLFSLFRKNKQETAPEGKYHSRAEDDPQPARSRSRKSARRDEAADPVLPEKKRARRRLVGAFALVLAAIIGLPMILDSEPQELAQDIVIQIPSRDQEPVRAPVAAQTPGSSNTADASLDDGEELVEVAPTPVTPAVVSVAPVKTETPRPTPPSVAKPAAASNAPPAKATVPTVPAVTKNPAPSPRAIDEEARALALLEGRPVPVDNRNSEKFVVQVAALTSQAKVNELKAVLKNAGINSFTQTVSTASGTATRIRVGPFSSRSEAEAMQSRIKNLGLNGTLIPG